MSTTRRLARTIIAAAGCLAALPALASDPPVTDAATLATLDKVIDLAPEPPPPATLPSGVIDAPIGADVAPSVT